MIPTNLEGARCLDKGDIFTATDAESHEYAKAHCETCPVFAPCAKWREEALDAHYLRREVSGTWAGVLFKPASRSGKKRGRDAA